MLVISQKKGEKLHIGRDITVTVVDIKANKVRLGIEAPSELTIFAHVNSAQVALLALTLHKSSSLSLSQTSTSL